MSTRVLFVLHNHPSVIPGGAEAYALELFEAMRGSPDFDPLLVARIGSTVAHRRHGHPGAPFSVIDGDPGQYFIFTETDHFDFFKLSLRDKSFYSRHFAEFLATHRPDVVHIQHTLFLGFDLVSLVRRVLPEAPIVYTLHEFLPICHHHGQLVRTMNDELCRRASPRRCNECFPSISPQDFFLRERFIKSHLSHVDLFLAPSRFLRDRYVEWGIPPERIRVEDYGRRAVEPAPRPDTDRPRNRIGFFGQMSHFKGVDVLVEAMRLVAEEEPAAHCWIHGANLEIQPPAFQEAFRNALAGATNVTMVGRYGAEEVSRLMAGIDWVVVPSRWWENSPLVIQEAFLHGRPVICSGIGGMAEKVRDGVDGLHFRVGDAQSLAETIVRAIRTPGLWDELHENVPPIYDMDEHVETLSSIYAAVRGAKTREAIA